MIELEKIRMVIYGNPKAQKRHRFARQGNYVKTYDPSKSDKEDLICQILKYRPEKPFDCPIKLICMYYMPIPKSYSKRKKLRLSNEMTPHIKRPDLDNLDKIFMDILSSIFYNDDSQVFIKESYKYYSDKPRTEITLETYPIYGLFYKERY